MSGNVLLNETNCDWLFDMSVKRPQGRALAIESCPLYQIFSLATRDYLVVDKLISAKKAQDELAS